MSHSTSMTITLDPVIDSVINLGRVYISPYVNFGDNILNNSVLAVLELGFTFTKIGAKQIGKMAYRKLYPNLESVKQDELDTKSDDINLEVISATLSDGLFPLERAVLRVKINKKLQSRGWSGFRYKKSVTKDWMQIHLMEWYRKNYHIPLCNRDEIILDDFSLEPALSKSSAQALSSTGSEQVCWVSKGHVVGMVKKSSHVTIFSDSIIALDVFLEMFKDIKAPLLLSLPESNDENIEGTKIRKPMVTYDALKMYNGENEDKYLLDDRWILDAMVFSQKNLLSELISRYRRDLKSKNPYTIKKLGILLSGPPGTGKTTVAASLANELQKSLVTIDLTQVKSKDEFISLMKCCKDSIIFFDEFDLLIQSLIRTNTSNSHSIHEQKMKEMKRRLTDFKLLGSEEELKSLQKEYFAGLTKGKSAPIDLAFLLSQLDGGRDDSGRIIIATTNHPENIPPALLRPGRFDVKITLGNYLSEEIKELLTKIYHPLSTKQIEWLKKQTFKDDIWSPAECMLAHHTFGDLERTVNYIQTQLPGSFDMKYSPVKEKEKEKEKEKKKRKRREGEEKMNKKEKRESPRQQKQM